MGQKSESGAGDGLARKEYSAPTIASLGVSRGTEKGYPAPEGEQICASLCSYYTTSAPG